MEKSSFFNSINGDRRYNAEDFALFFSEFFTNGVFNNGLKVKEDNGMNIIIEPGNGHINGYRYVNTLELSKTIDVADGIMGRIDNVVLRLDLTNRKIDIQIIKGDIAKKPVAPDLVRNENIYDLRLATINISPAITEITNSMINDCRFNENDCGNVIGTVKELSTIDIFLQFESAFNEWFDKMKGQLSTDAAGNLQNEIDEIKRNYIYYTQIEEIEM